MKIRLTLAATAMAVAGFALVPSAASAANLILNGDFELAGPNNSPVDWTVAPGNEIQDLTGADYIPCCGVTGTAAELANHFASFGSGNVDNISTLSQTFSTTSGQSYLVSFDAGALGAGSQDLISLSSGTGVLASLEITTIANDNLDQTFSPYSFSFTADGTSTTLDFSAVGQGNNIDPVLDNVSVTAVPEPATWAMFLVGFGGIGFMMRNSRRKGAVATA